MTEVDDRVQVIVDRMGANKQLRILEAGCGSASRCRIPSSQAVGIDISQEALDRNTHLDEKILGDIQTFRLEASSFDVIFCWDVLEHLEQPEKALVNFAHSLREDGIIVLGCPVARSLKGVITKYSPHWFHVLVYRYALRDKNAGKPGYPPFKTVFNDSMSPSSLLQFARENHLLVDQVKLYEGAAQLLARQRRPFVNLGLRVLGPAIKILTFGLLDPYMCDLLIVLRKPARSDGSSYRDLPRSASSRPIPERINENVRREPLAG
jgi:SAM-dependent methyltransferase